MILRMRKQPLKHIINYTSAVNTKEPLQTRQRPIVVQIAKTVNALEINVQIAAKMVSAL